MKHIEKQYKNINSGQRGGGSGAAGPSNLGGASGVPGGYGPGAGAGQGGHLSSHALDVEATLDLLISAVNSLMGEEKGEVFIKYAPVVCKGGSAGCEPSENGCTAHSLIDTPSSKGSETVDKDFDLEALLEEYGQNQHCWNYEIDHEEAKQRMSEILSTLQARLK
jgi:hypothetical protein